MFNELFVEVNMYLISVAIEMFLICPLFLAKNSLNLPIL